VGVSPRTFYIRTGQKFNRVEGKPMAAGACGTWPVGMKYFVRVKGETVVQFHADGPRTISYVNPADGPRNERKWPSRALVA
jgi:hypothetical protein